MHIWNSLAASMQQSKADQTQLLKYMSLSGICDTHWPGIKHDKKEEDLMRCRKGLCSGNGCSPSPFQDPQHHRRDTHTAPHLPHQPCRQKIEQFGVLMNVPQH